MIIIYRKFRKNEIKINIKYKKCILYINKNGK